jgi:hypothetical protein
MPPGWLRVVYLQEKKFSDYLHIPLERYIFHLFFNQVNINHLILKIFGTLSTYARTDLEI